MAEQKLEKLIKNNPEKAGELWELMKKHGPSSDGCYFGFCFRTDEECAAVTAEAALMVRLADFFGLEAWCCDLDEEEDGTRFFNLYMENAAREDEFYSLMDAQAA